MSTKHLLTAGIALALGVAWTAGPALAQQTTGEKIENKAERAKDKAEDKAERAKDKAEDKAERAKDKAERTKDKAEAKAERAKDKAEAKADRAADKTDSKMDRAKDKARDIKDKVKDKTSELADKAKDKTADLTDKAKTKMDRAGDMDNKHDVMAMQRSLREKGYDPGPTDGIVGPRTRAALIDYQKKEGLTPSGQWDDDTKARLGVRATAAPDQTAVSASPADPRGEKTDRVTPPPTKRNAP